MKETVLKPFRLPSARWVSLALVLAVGGAFALPARPASTGEAPAYPNLKTLPPSSLMIDPPRSGRSNYLLRFSNTVLNDGEGALELRRDGTGEAPMAYQRFYDSAGQYIRDPQGNPVEQPIGTFEYHAAHRHWHFNDFARYELWTKAEYEEWEASGRAEGEPLGTSEKVTFCIIDSIHVDPKSPRGPDRPRYTARTLPGGYRQCEATQGLSVGWADIYSYVLEDQWVELGPRPLRRGNYLLRTVADHENRIYESDGKTDASREGERDNEATFKFRIKKKGTLEDGWLKRKRPGKGSTGGGDEE